MYVRERRRRRRAGCGTAAELGARNVELLDLYGRARCWVRGRARGSGRGMSRVRDWARVRDGVRVWVRNGYKRCDELTDSRTRDRSWN